jgi:DNA-binding LacI/PurR family transcriptional regulator
VEKAKRDLLAEGVLETLPGRKGNFVREQTDRVSTDFIGAVLDNVQDPYFAEIHRGIEDKLWEHRFHPILCNTYYDIEKVEAFFDSLLQREVAGVLFVPLRETEEQRSTKRIVARLTAQQIPCILVDRYLPDRRIPAVVSDNQQASKELTQCLIQKGHTRILTLAGVRCSAMAERVQGHLEALQEAGIKSDPNLLIQIEDDLLILHTQPQYQQELARIRDCVANAGDFTACYTLNSAMLRAAIHIISTDTRFKKPLEIATCDYSIPEIKSITNRAMVLKQPGYQLGREAARLLIDTIRNPDQAVTQIRLQSEIVEEVIE